MNNFLRVLYSCSWVTTICPNSGLQFSDCRPCLDDTKWVYPLRGLNTNGKQIAVSVFTEVDSTATADMYVAQAGDNSRGFSNIDLAPGNAAVPTFLVCTTNYLVLNGRRNVDIKY